MDHFYTLHNLLVALIIILVLVLFLIIGVLIFGYYKYKNIQNRDRWSSLIDDTIMGAIIDGVPSVVNNPELQNLLKKKQFRLLFLESLVATTRRFSGAAVQEIYKLFHALDLKNDALDNLSSKNKKHLIAGGIQELTAMKALDALPEIEKSLQNPNPVIFQEGQYAMINLKGFEGLKFLDTLTHPLSDWQQMRLLDAIKMIPAEEKDTLCNWLESSNESIVVFTLRLIRKLQLFEYYNNVESLQNHPSQKIKIQVYKTLQALENENTVDELIQAFETEEVTVQKEILKALKVSKNNKSEEFLKLQLTEHPFPSVRLIAAEALLELGKRPFLESLKYSHDTTISNIVKHTLAEKV